MQTRNALQSDALSLAVVDAVATVTINRPSAKNAMTQAMWRALPGLFAKIEADSSIRVVILRGEGRDFCAGADIMEFDAVRGSAEKARLYERENAAAFAAVATCRLPTIAAIRGICFGGGFGLAASCDLRLAAEDALFSVPAAKLGLAYPAESMATIVHALGEQTAKYLAFTAARLDAQAALRAGFLLEICAGDLDSRVEALARTIARNAPLSIRASKASIGAVLGANPVALAEAARLGDLTFDSADYAEGRKAFREKRAPVFEGY